MKGLSENHLVEDGLENLVADGPPPQSSLRSRFILEGEGEVEALLTDRCLSCHHCAEDTERSSTTCWGLTTVSEMPTELLLSNIYAVELAGRGSVHETKAAAATYCLLGIDSKVLEYFYRFVVHFVQKSSKQHSVWIPKTLVFGHPDPETCTLWFERIHNIITSDVKRPKNLLIFVNPLSGKRHASKTWEGVQSFFDRAKIITKVVTTQRSGHAFDIMKEITNDELNSYDGVVTVGGDGFFNEVLNGLLMGRHKAPYPPTPSEVQYYIQEDASTIHGHSKDLKLKEHAVQPVQSVEEQSELDSLPPSHPLLQESVASRMETSHSSCSLASEYNAFPDTIAEGEDFVDQASESSATNLRTQYRMIRLGAAQDRVQGSCVKEEATTLFPLPNPSFRIGIIPAGSTDAIVISTTGARDPVTSAMQIILGKRIALDITQVVSWKSNSKSPEEAPRVRYVASFAGYGFYGDVIKESESYRWMGPARYDYSGTSVFMRHRSYEAEVAFVKVPDHTAPYATKSGLSGGQTNVGGKRKEEICRVNCTVCADGINSEPSVSTGGLEMLSHTRSQIPRWLKAKGLFLSVGAAVMSCRNEKAPDGVVANAHLADGFLHLVLIRECSRASYLWHLLKLTRKGANPLDFKFVEHYKTSAFTFVSHGQESIWNVDGELFPAHQLSAQVFRGLITLFASGPEV
ncbi:ceramide kinase isoform X1 [Cryptomeria japonica]|uniref:ceramide kinase isoform X1 n=2 Tax=Cryptomeria japonica TaxID=3369 RepID=UPI0025AC9DAB|nr:ceramide kinase isoform X1 [Cryptomeria japonica]